MPESSQLQDFDLLEGAARDFAESRGFGPLSTDSMQWTLIHHCCARSEHHRGMHEVLKSLLAVCPIEIVDQKTGGGTPSGWSALSLLCNARDAANTRIGMVRMMLERRADTEASNPQGSTPLDSRLRERVLVSRALALGSQSRPQRDEKGRAERVGRDTEGPDAGSIGLHRVCRSQS